jgi:hypothetical protein
MKAVSQKRLLFIFWKQFVLFSQYKGKKQQSKQKIRFLFVVILQKPLQLIKN